MSNEKTVTPRKNRTWLYALPTVAVVILSFSVVLNLQHENQDMMTVPIVESSPKAKTSAPKPQVTIKRTQSNQSKDTVVNFNTVEEQIPTVTVEKKIAVSKLQKPQKSPLKKERKNTSTTNLEPIPMPVYEEAVAGAVAADDRFQDKLMEQEKDEKAAARSALMYQEQNKSSRKNQQTLSSQSKIKSLKILIAEKNKQQAQELLNTLKANYPEYNFKEFDEMVLHL